MDEIIKLKIEIVINKILYDKNIIERDIYEKTANRLYKKRLDKKERSVLI